MKQLKKRLVERVLVGELNSHLKRQAADETIVPNRGMAPTMKILGHKLENFTLKGFQTSNIYSSNKLKIKWPKNKLCWS